MNHAQPQYYIRANSRCRTHARGAVIVYTGPRSGIPRGWTYAGRVPEIPQGDLCGLV